MKLFSFDVESVGLYGEGYAVGGGLFENGKELWSFKYACDPDAALGSEEDRKWIMENIPPIAITHDDAYLVRAEFWERWSEARVEGAYAIADCCYPVETKFLTDCVKAMAMEDIYKWNAPYPLLDVSSIILAKGGDPIQKFDRLPNELPEHCPLADARQSARIAFKWLNNVRSHQI